MNFITGLVKRLGLIALMALTAYGGAQLFLGYKRGAAMQRYGVAASLSPVVDACVDALRTARKTFVNGVTADDGCVCAVGAAAGAPGFEEAAAIPGVRVALGVAPIYDFLQRANKSAQRRAEPASVAPDRIARAATAFAAAVRQCSRGGATPA